MSAVELRKRLIDKIQITENESLLEEAYRLVHLGEEDMEVYKLNEDQNKAIEEARQQIKGGQFLTDEQANNDIERWLNK